MSRRTFLKGAGGIIAFTSLPKFEMPTPPRPITFLGIPIVFNEGLAPDDFILVTPEAAKKIGAMWLHVFDEQFFCTRCGRSAETVVDTAASCIQVDKR